MAPPRRRTFGNNRISNAQIETLVSYMEQHTLFARGQITKLGCQGQINFRQMWIELTKTLNEMGPCITDVKGWQEKWSRMRLTAKLQKAQFTKALHKIGHDNQTVLLSSTNERIASIFGKYGNGIQIGRELGFSKCKWIQQTAQEPPKFSDPATCSDELDWLPDVPYIHCFELSTVFQGVPEYMNSLMHMFDEHFSSIFLEMQRSTKNARFSWRSSVERPSYQGADMCFATTAYMRGLIRKWNARYAE